MHRDRHQELFVVPIHTSNLKRAEPAARRMNKFVQSKDESIHASNCLKSITNKYVENVFGGNTTAE